MYITNVQKAEALKTPSGKSVRWLLSSENGVPNFEMRYFEVEKGIEGKEESHPFEHEVFVIKGQGLIRSGDKSLTIKAGDAIYIAPDEPHQFLSLGEEESLGFICIIPKGCEDHLKRGA
ncbi:MAG: cupin domain-containing protein [Deltaproteobacteria bacterium]|nr:cupin domain-containing protein [Deltaproteobacteria bacterium]